MSIDYFRISSSDICETFELISGLTGDLDSNLVVVQSGAPISSIQTTRMVTVTERLLLASLGRQSSVLRSSPH